MSDPLETYQSVRLQQTKKNLEAHFFGVSLCQSLTQAEDIIASQIVEQSEAKTIGFGGSATVGQSNLVSKLKAISSLEVFDRNNPNLSPVERSELSRKCLTADLFISSVNAISINGQLIGIDKMGNRLAALIYGARKVALVVGRNKLTDNLESALARAKNVASPINAMRFEADVPCAKTGRCYDCQNPNRLCAVTAVIERSFPPQRIHVLLVNQDLGF
ncbi:MAG: lactate utilization protein [Deltaproteobacteria bacterium]|nr:lactate utilization protein [Deltaproteobacteria bacterium]